MSEDQYLDRTPDLVAKVRAMREAAEKEMDRFTRVADYYVRRVVGQGSKASPVSVENVPPSSVSERAKKRVTSSASAQASIEFASAPAERADEEEGA
ncbi:hypothetical protein [Paracidobacterium acidisoli]|uniref:Uncharacterized protein n=1 Tax=Paracidobacterium acidisoli TaxID=2303751 RepID=A0A372IKK6_9BACT|nr:hypothetical protein [Paracidobacterium acidisoli]MBT9333015.1 hypothetical protein [Paracidobacterium acidisoli]